jgi:uncharacterized membrane protein YebE (DUF533 family)
VDAKSLIDQLLGAGRDLAARGTEVAERKLGVPAEGPERDAMLGGLGKGALLGGALALLLGTKAGRQLGGSAVTVGGLAALGGIAYKAYRDWQAAQGGGAPEPGTPVDRLTGPQAESRGQALMRAMIGAARADGHIDEAERVRITGQVQRMGLDAEWSRFLLAELDRPLDAAAVARGADSPEAAAEIYLVSLTAIDLDDPRERSYLDTLARHLRLAPDLVRRLELEAAGAGASRA